MIENEPKSSPTAARSFYPSMVFSRRFRRKSRLLQWLVFFSSVQRVTSTFLFICSTSYLAEVNPDITSNILFQSSHGSKFGCSDITFSKFRHNLFSALRLSFLDSAPPIFLTIFDRVDEKSKSVPSGAPIRFNFWVFLGAVEENTLTLLSPFAVFEPQIWRRFGPFPACFYYSHIC